MRDRQTDRQTDREQIKSFSWAPSKNVVVNAGLVLFGAIFKLRRRKKALNTVSITACNLTRRRRLTNNNMILQGQVYLTTKANHGPYHFKLCRRGSSVQFNVVIMCREKFICGVRNNYQLKHKVIHLRHP